MSRLFSAFCPLAWRARSQFAHSLVSVPLFTCGYPSCNVVLRSIIWTILAIIVIINTTLLKRDTFFFFPRFWKLSKERSSYLVHLFSLASVKWTKREVFCAMFFLAVPCLLIWRMVRSCLLFAGVYVRSAGKRDSALFVCSEHSNAAGHTLVAV